MKRTKFILAAILLFLSYVKMNGQCESALLSDDFSTPGLWTTAGSSSNGDISITSGTFERVFWDDFGNRQNKRLYRDVSSALPVSSSWRIEWEFEVEDEDLPTCVGAMAMAVTSDNAHPRFATPGGGTETDQNTIEVLVGSEDCGNNPVYFFVSSKLGIIRQSYTPHINFPPGEVNYMRLQRVSSTQCVLSVYSDASRTTHRSGSPICFMVNSQIDDLAYLQMGLWTSASASRYITAYADNLCIYNSNVDGGCSVSEECEIEADFDVSLDLYTCDLTFTDETVYGFGTNPIGNYIIEFGDGTTGQIPPGGSITHSYDYSTTPYAYCIHLFAYNTEYECCSQDFCGNKLVNCDNPERLGGGTGQAEEPSPLRNVQLYPNPGEQMVNLRSEKPVKALHIYNSNGQLMRTESGMDKNFLQLDLQAFPDGIYFFELDLGDEIVTEKFSKIQ